MSTSPTIEAVRGLPLALFCLLICVCWQLTASVVTVLSARPRSPGLAAPLSVCLCAIRYGSSVCCGRFVFPCATLPRFLCLVLFFLVVSCWLRSRRSRRLCSEGRRLRRDVGCLCVVMSGLRSRWVLYVLMGVRSLEDGSVVTWRLYSIGLVNRLFRLHILRRLCCSGPILCLSFGCVSFETAWVSLSLCLCPSVFCVLVEGARRVLDPWLFVCSSSSPRLKRGTWRVLHCLAFSLTSQCVWTRVGS